MAVGLAVRPGWPGAEQIVLNAFQGDGCDHHCGRDRRGQRDPSDLHALVPSTTRARLGCRSFLGRCVVGCRGLLVEGVGYLVQGQVLGFGQVAGDEPDGQHGEDREQHHQHR